MSNNNNNSNQDQEGRNTTNASNIDTSITAASVEIPSNSVMTLENTVVRHETRVLLRHLSSGGGGEGRIDNDPVIHPNRNNNNKGYPYYDSNSNSKWSSDKYNLDLEMFVQQLPKVELHVHLDGTFDPDVLWEYIQQNKPESLEGLPVETIMPWETDEIITSKTDDDDDNNDDNKNLGQRRNVLPIRQLVSQCQSRQEYHDLITCRRPSPSPMTSTTTTTNLDAPVADCTPRRSLNDMLRCFFLFLPTVQQNLPFLEQLAYDFVQRQWEQNCVYTEVRYSPFLLAERFDSNDGDSKNNNDPLQEITGEDVYLAITRGLRRGCQDFGSRRRHHHDNNDNLSNNLSNGLTVNQILVCISWRPDWAEPTLALVEKYRNDFPCAAVGIDIGAGEEHFDGESFPQFHQPHVQVMQKAKQAQIPISLHAGEVRSPSRQTEEKEEQQQQPAQEQRLGSFERSAQNVRRAVWEYGAARIGHGYHIASNPELMREMKEAGIHFEVCPTSSVETGSWEYELVSDNDYHKNSNNSMNNADDESNSNHRRPGEPLASHNPPISSLSTTTRLRKDWTKHPGRIMQNHGLSISLNSDDPAVFHTSLAWQYRTALVKMGMTPRDVYQTNLDAIHAAFCDESTKQGLQQQIQHFWQQHEQQQQSSTVSAEQTDAAVSANLFYQNAATAHSAEALLESAAAASKAPAANATMRNMPFYRRSVSENFKDRVYLQTHPSTILDVVETRNINTTTTTTTTTTNNNPPQQDALASILTGTTTAVNRAQDDEAQVIQFYT